jgi:hypothetical protein
MNRFVCVSIVVFFLVSLFSSRSSALPAPNAYRDNDVLALNFLLTLERLESALYQWGASQYDLQAYLSAGYNSTIYDRFALIAAHEQAHVETLIFVVDGLVAGSALGPCSYNFSSITSLPVFVSTAMGFEGLGVSAYDGVLNRVFDKDIQQLLATIATVEARHAAFLNLLDNTSPFPAITDTPLAPTQVLALGSPYFITCPFSFDLLNPSEISDIGA